MPLNGFSNQTRAAAWLSDDLTAQTLFDESLDPALPAAPGLPIGQSADPRPMARTAGLVLTVLAVGLLQSTLAPAATLPPGSKDWPVPRAARPAAGLLRSVTRPLLDTVAATPDPFSQKSWPLPRVRRVGTLLIDTSTEIEDVTAPFTSSAWPLPARRSWQVVPQSRTVAGPDAAVVVSPPFSQTGWPLFARRSQLLSASTSSPGAPAAVVGQAPFAQDDWPLPIRPRVTVRDEGSSLVVDTAVPPFSQSGWPLVVRRYALISASTSVAGPAVAAPAPFSQADWPLAVRRVVSIPPRLWTQGRPTYLVDATVPGEAVFDLPAPRARRAVVDWTQSRPILAIDQPAFGPTDWPNPRGAARALDLRTWTGNLLESTLALPFVPPPFYQTDWPNPQAKARAIDLRTSIATRPFYFLDPTFPVYDRPNPRLPGRALDLLTWTQTLAGVLSAPLQLPFDLTEWPNPRPPARALELGTWTQTGFRLLTAPPPFAWSGWTIPLAKVPVVDLRTHLQAVRLTLIGQDVFYNGPGRQPVYAYPNPLPKPALRDLRTWRHGAFELLLSGTPITLTDFFLVGAVDRWFVVDAVGGRWFMVGADGRLFEVDP
jgi:hypothetical protein